MTKKTKSMAKFPIVAVMVVAVAMIGCKNNEEQNPSKPNYSIEKQWLMDETLPMEVLDQVLQAKCLIDISVTQPGNIIMAINQDALGSLMGLPEGTYFYQEASPVVITPKDETSGTIVFSRTDEDGNKEELTLTYSDLTENTVSFIGISDGKAEKMTAKAVTEKVNLLFHSGE